MVIVNADGKIVVVNAQTEILFGYSRQELIGRPVEILIPARLDHIHVRHRASFLAEPHVRPMGAGQELLDRKSTRLNSSHSQISYAVFCLKKKDSTPNSSRNNSLPWTTCRS